MRFAGETTSSMRFKISSLSAEEDENLTRSKELDFGDRPNRFNDSPTYIHRQMRSVRFLYCGYIVRRVGKTYIITRIKHINELRMRRLTLHSACTCFSRLELAAFGMVTSSTYYRCLSDCAEDVLFRAEFCGVEKGKV